MKTCSNVVCVLGGLVDGGVVVSFFARRVLAGLLGGSDTDWERVERVRAGAAWSESMVSLPIA
jgi:hypothetical protein